MTAIKFDVKKIIRQNCSKFEPYIAGRPVETIKRELGLKKVIKLASNENPLGPSPKAVAAVKKSLDKIYFYPDSNSWILREALSKKFKISPENITLGCGSDEIIEIIAKLFFNPSDEIIISEYSFLRYKMAGELMGSTVITVPMKNYKHDLNATADLITSKTKAIFIANPNNPTGTYNTVEEIEAFLKIVIKKVPVNPPLVILDEAYYEYASTESDYPQTINYLSKYPNLIILRTFSKIYGLAGMRVGYGFGSKEVIDYIERIRPPFNINLLAQSAAAASITDTSQVKKSISLVQSQKKFLYSELDRLNIKYIPSAANFILFEVTKFSGKEAFIKLLKSGVIVRAMDEYKLPNHIRVSIGLPEENRFFIKNLENLKIC